MSHATQTGQNLFHTTSHPGHLGRLGFRVTGLPAFDDNYIWLVQAEADAHALNPQAALVVVDPGDAAPVIDYCRRHGLVPTQIWLTHHHADHTGGVAAICAWANQHLPAGGITVYGPAVEAIPGVTHPLSGGEQIHLGDQVVDVLAVPGHTRGHLAYYIGGKHDSHQGSKKKLAEGLQLREVQSPYDLPALFCGDLLFGLGCGRLFEGTAAQMYESLSRIAALPPTTRVYCAHEYTLMNLPFALAVDPDNAVLQSRGALIKRRRQAGEPTVPLSLAEECATNPFLRCSAQALRTAAIVDHGASEVDVFARLREMRNTFKAR